MHSGGARVAHARSGANAWQGKRRCMLWVVLVSEAAEGQRARAAARVRRTQAVVQHGRARAGEAVGCGFLPVHPTVDKKCGST